MNNNQNSSSEELLKSKKYDDYIKLTEAALYGDEEENHVARLVGTIYEKSIVDGYWLIEAFVNRFPSSLHPIRVFLSDLLASQEQYDIASNEARIYLWTLKDSNALTDTIDNPIILEGASRAYLLLTSIYTEAGARNYSIRALQEALKHNLTNDWNTRINNEITNLQKELDISQNNQLDQRWEDFFDSGNDWDYINSLCASQNFDSLRKRCELINDNFKYNPAYKIDNNELYMLVHQIDKNTFVLT